MATPALLAAEVAAARQTQHVAVAAAVASTAAQSWSLINPFEIISSWRRLLARPLAMLIAGQRLIARGADRYVSDALDAQGVTARAAGELVPDQFAGTAADGRPLDSLLYQPVVKTLSLLGTGTSAERALAAGAIDLDMIVRSEIADAARVSTGVAVAARHGASYTRLLQGPGSCSRCVVLAGRRYRWSAGFERHPRCDCIHVPTGDEVPDGLVADPAAYFDSLTKAEQDRTFTIVGAQAIRDGADISRVVNARRGMSTTVTPSGRHQLATQRVNGRDVFVTTERTTRRARRSGPRVRLMPEQIYLDARGDRDEAVRLLRLHGYLR